MSNCPVGIPPQKYETFCQKFEQVTLNAIRNVLPDRAIVQACEATGHTYRERRITPVLTVLHMILAAIWPEESFNASWQVMWDTFVSSFPHLQGRSPSRGRVAEARARLPIRLWRHLFEWVCQQAQERSEPFDLWKGHRVVLADGTCVSMSDQPELVKAFGVNTGRHGQGRYPLARLVTLCLAGTRVILDYAIGRYDDGESTLTFPLLDHLQKGDLLIADRHFAAAHYYVYYQRKGLEFLTRAHQRLKISRIKRLVHYGPGDFIGRLHINKRYRQDDQSLPPSLAVRFIMATLRVRGQLQVVWFVTSLLDSDRYPAEQIIELYTRRWRIETLFREVKIELSVDVLRSQTPDGVRKEIIARLAALNIVRTIMLEAAIYRGVDPLRISFVHSLRAILSFSPMLAWAPLSQLPDIYRAMLAEIGSHVVPERPGRLEPRSITRERKHYPALRRMTRAQWRAAHAA